MRLASAAQILFVPINDKSVTLKNLNARARASLCACACEVDGNSASGSFWYKKILCLKLGFVKWFFYICKSIVNLIIKVMSTKVAKFFKQYGIYRSEVYTMKAALWRLSISQSDFSRYLQMDSKNLSLILNGKIVPNAALWSYMKFVLYSSRGRNVLITWLEKHGTSSLERFKPRSVPRNLYIPIEVPGINVDLPF